MRDLPSLNGKNFEEAVLKKIQPVINWQELALKKVPRLCEEG